jgi:hypothetical protein
VHARRSRVRRRDVAPPDEQRRRVGLGAGDHDRAHLDGDGATVLLVGPLHQPAEEVGARGEERDLERLGVRAERAFVVGRQVRGDREVGESVERADRLAEVVVCVGGVAAAAARVGCDEVAEHEPRG